MMIDRLRRRGTPRAVALTLAALLSSAPAQAVDAPRLQSLANAVQSLPADEAPALTAQDDSASAPRFTLLGEGEASYYGNELAGNRTATGERFNPQGLTAAHRTLPLGTKLRVTNLANGRSVIVRVNDRGPFVRSRLIDVSLGAAREIGMVARGHAAVRLEVVRSA